MTGASVVGLLEIRAMPVLWEPGRLQYDRVKTE